MNLIRPLFLNLLENNPDLTKNNIINFSELNKYYHIITKIYAYIIKHLNITLVKKVNIKSHGTQLNEAIHLNSDFMSEEIKMELSDNLKYLYKYELNLVFKGKEYTANIQIYSKNNLKPSILNSDYKQIFYRSLLLSVLNEMPRPLNIIIYLSDSKKECHLPKNGTLGSECVNSGSTSFYHMEEDKINNYTIIFRKEELKKLILHELIHNLDYDFKNKLDLNLSQFLNIAPSVPLKVYEAYTEFTALIIHCILLSYEKEYKNNIRYAKKLIYLNIQFNLFQCAKILHHFSYNSVHDFFRPYGNSDSNGSNGSSKDSKGLFSQTTAVLSYFIIKTALLVQFNRSILFVNKNTKLFKMTTSNSSENSSGNSSENTNRIRAFGKLILESLFSKSFINGIDSYLKFITKTSKKTSKKTSNDTSKINRSLMGTFRMTLE